MATILVRNCKHGTLSVLETPYCWSVGDIFYPVSLREQFPGKNENKHMVMFYSDTLSVEEVNELKELMENAQNSPVQYIHVQ